MYEFYNPHPQNKNVGDCVKRALTSATGKSYQEVSRELNRIKREQGASAYNSSSVWKAYLDNMKAVKIPFNAEAGKPRMNGYRFCEAYPKGRYVLRMAGHLSNCVDGVIYDSWDCRDKCVYCAWEIPQESVVADEDITEQVASPAPEAQVVISGNQIIENLSKLTGIKIKKTKKNELWIPLTEESHDVVLHALLDIKRLRWETKRGSMKTTITCPSIGAILILKNGNNPYVWCIKDKS